LVFSLIACSSGDRVCHVSTRAPVSEHVHEMSPPQAIGCPVIGDRVRISATPHSTMDWA
jgi:hypothetical protein